MKFLILLIFISTAFAKMTEIEAKFIIQTLLQELRVPTMEIIQRVYHFPYTSIDCQGNKSYLDAETLKGRAVKNHVESENEEAQILLQLNRRLREQIARNQHFHFDDPELKNFRIISIDGYDFKAQLQNVEYAVKRADNNFKIESETWTC
ncbi:unnamed protein product [Caenorhabditis angaria]|uniref:Uncharacterized protein n=1 Tax=Caenorhabditis angaria TaxID=860376 RepID=A0A9P1IIJ3_9PELO|nr:unnamed protein product [Caenorhabditis angaria]